jgi:hypothetical protein
MPESCPTFAMAALAGIGNLPDTITNRAVTIRMRRRAPGERVEPFPIRRDTPRLHDLRDEIAGWVRASLNELRDAEPVLPVDDRAADNWTPLAAVSDLAGGDWPDRARKAAEVLTHESDETEAALSLSRRLLADLRDIFGDARCLYTTTILERLYRVAEAPWSTWKGRGLTDRDLADKLREYGVRSRDVRERGTGPQRKGYTADDRFGAWARYLHRDIRDIGDSAGQGGFAGRGCRGYPPDAETPTGRNGRCAKCGDDCRRYGEGGSPLYDTCRTERGAGRSLKDCATCRQQFRPARSDAMYCSAACSQKAYRQRQSEKRRKP